MRVLTAEELLQVWEVALTLPPLERPIALVAACEGTTREEAAELTIGQRDAILLELRERTFGSRLVAFATCPNCNEKLEMAFHVQDFTAGETVNSKEKLIVELDGFHVRFRVPNSTNLQALAGEQDLGAARKKLLSLCIQTAQKDNVPIAPDQLPPHVVRAIVEQMEQADPQANVFLSLSCPVCAHQWELPFDIGSFFWKEIEAWAHRVLNDVHILASTYGWKESEILSLSAGRRQLYLDLITR